MSRTTWSMTDEAAEALETAADRHEDESATAFILRVAEIVRVENSRTTVTDHNGSDSDGSECDLPGDVLTEEHIDDIANKAARQTVADLESRLR